MEWGGGVLFLLTCEAVAAIVVNITVTRDTPIHRPHDLDYYQGYSTSLEARHVHKTW
jgi:hypothetical protein